MSGLPATFLVTFMRTVLLYILLFLLLLLVLFYFWGSSGSQPQEALNQIKTYRQQPDPPADTLSVVTYNIGYLSGMTNNLAVKPGKDLFEANLKKARDLLNTLQADIVGFQEIDYGSSRSYQVDQLDALAQDYYQGVVAINWDKNYVPFPYWPPAVQFGKMLSGQAILSRFPISNGQRQVLEKPREAPFYYNAFYLDRLVQVAEISLGAETLVVLNVHLEAFDQQTREAQAQVLLDMVDSLAAKGPLLLVGDFNARPPFAKDQLTDETTMRLFFDHPQLSPAITQSQYLQQEERYFTFDSRKPYEMLDYIFYTHESIKPLAARVVREADEISDHLPVFMSFTLVD